jgi:hypothetical protein
LIDEAFELKFLFFYFNFAAPSGLGTRHYVTFMLFLGMANAYIMRTNMSVAIVAMVNHTAIHTNPEIFVEECPEKDYGNNTDHQQDGEFAWSTSKQGWILSSFFYGYVLTQVTKLYCVKCLRKFQRTNAA